MMQPACDDLFTDNRTDRETTLTERR
jgi:hypothetical protein